MTCGIPDNWPIVALLMIAIGAGGRLMYEAIIDLLHFAMKRSDNYMHHYSKQRKQ